MLVLLIISAFVFVSCSQEAGGAAGGGGGGVPGPAPKPKEEVKNVLGEKVKAIVDEKFETDPPYVVKGDGATIEKAEGEGIEGAALKVTTNFIYGQVAIDMTKYYARGKSYYIEAWFKNAADVEGAREGDDRKAKIDFSLITGGGINYDGPSPYGTYHKKGQEYDIPGQYDGSMLGNDEAMETFEIETNLILGEGGGEDLSDGKWHKVCGILDAEAIEYIITNMDELCHYDGEPTLYQFNIILLVGTYEEESVGLGQSGYKYYLDNLKIVDLNDDLEAEGKTYEEPEEEEGAEGEEGEEGGEA